LLALLKSLSLLLSLHSESGLQAAPASPQAWSLPQLPIILKSTHQRPKEKRPGANSHRPLPHIRPSIIPCWRPGQQSIRMLPVIFLPCPLPQGCLSVSLWIQTLQCPVTSILRGRDEITHSFSSS
jgi:hypothetical protein